MPIKLFPLLKVLDLLFVGTFCVLFIACFVFAYQWYSHANSKNSVPINIASALFVSLIGGYPIVMAMSALYKGIRRLLDIG